MKLKLIIRLAVILSIVLLCTAFGVYSFFRLSAEEHRQDFDLFTLVPDDVSAVVETDQLDELVRSIDGMKCSQDGVFLYASDLFVLLKDELHALQDEAPHGLSIQMNKMLLSFHKPDDPTNQVLYCAMGRGDYDLMENFIEKSTSAAFPSKYIDYHGEEIRIYPMVDGRFLSVCLTRNFLVASFQKRLIEQVIDTYHSRHSLAYMKSFKSLPIEAKMQAEARLYIRMTGVSMGADSLRKQTDVGDWTVYELKLEEEAIYCSGVCRDADTINQSFIHLLKQQQPTEVPSGVMYPSTTLLYHNYSLTDKRMTWDFLAQYAMTSDTLSALRWKSFVQEYGGEHVQFCLFTDSVSLAHRISGMSLQADSIVMWLSPGTTSGTFGSRLPSTSQGDSTVLGAMDKVGKKKGKGAVAGSKPALTKVVLSGVRINANEEEKKVSSSSVKDSSSTLVNENIDSSEDTEVVSSHAYARIYVVIGVLIAFGVLYIRKRIMGG